jgi:oligopeptide transport system permease protein
MIRFALRRMLGAIPVMFIIVTLVFFMVRLVPGGPFDGEKSVSPETQEALNAYYGLDKPLHAQYFSFLKNLAKGELGPSYKHQGWTVNELIADKAPVSLELGLYSLLFALLLGFGMGIFAAAFKDKKIGRAVSAASLAGICLPALLLGPLLILLFSLKFKAFNAMGWNFASDAVLPAISMGLFYSAWIARLTRASFISEGEKAYVRTAIAKGCTSRRVYFIHIMRNAVQPVVSYLGPAAAGLLTGSFVVETIFQIPGLGKFFISSALDSDYTMIMGCVIVYAFFIVFFNLLADLVLAFLNPRIAKEFKNG